MKFLIDANLPAIFPSKQQMEFIYINQLNPEWNDREIWQYALEYHLVIVTKDTDFFHWLVANQQSPKIVYLKIDNMRLKDFMNWLDINWLKITVLIEEHRLVTVYRDRMETLD